MVFDLGKYGNIGNRFEDDDVSLSARGGREADQVRPTPWVGRPLVAPPPLLISSGWLIGGSLP
jgi:hypothetical protein